MSKAFLNTAFSLSFDCLEVHIHDGSASVVHDKAARVRSGRSDFMIGKWAAC
jgi:hypothetical protein